MVIAILRRLGRRLPAFFMRFMFNLYPPYIGAGIKIEEISPDYLYLRVCLKLRFYNRNYVGTQFGGSIYAMTDPHYMFLIMNNLGPEYIVWDKAAKVDFLKPGKTHLYAEFKIDDELLNKIKLATREGAKFVFDLPVNVVDQNHQLIAHVSKTLYVRKKSTLKSLVN